MFLYIYLFILITAAEINYNASLLTNIVKSIDYYEDLITLNKGDEIDNFLLLKKIHIIDNRDEISLNKQISMYSQDFSGNVYLKK